MKKKTYSKCSSCVVSTLVDGRHGWRSNVFEIAERDCGHGRAAPAIDKVAHVEQILVLKDSRKKAVYSLGLLLDYGLLSSIEIGHLSVTVNVDALVA